MFSLANKHSSVWFVFFFTLFILYKLIYSWEHRSMVVYSSSTCEALGPILSATNKIETYYIKYSSVLFDV